MNLIKQFHEIAGALRTATRLMAEATAHIEQGERLPLKADPALLDSATAILDELDYGVVASEALGAAIKAKGG